MCQACSKKSPLPLVMPSSLGSWPTMIVNARPTMNPLQDGLADVVRQEPEPQHTGDQRREPGRERQAGSEGGEPVVADRHQVRDGGGRQRGGGGHGAPQRGVQDQRAWRGVQADDRRDAGDRCVGQRLGHQHSPHRQPGDDVAAQPRTLIAVQRREQPQHRRSLNADRGDHIQSPWQQRRRLAPACPVRRHPCVPRPRGPGWCTPAGGEL